MNIDEFCTSLDSRLARFASAEERLEAAANALSQAFSVKPSEVGIFSYDQTKEMFSFLWPLSLKSSGTIPLTAQGSLVARTGQERKGILNNAFASTPHASLFERFRQHDGHTAPIQKIMSVPLEKDGILCGVIQLSRKGEEPASAGRDFTQVELRALERVGKVIVRHI